MPHKYILWTAAADKSRRLQKKRNQFQFSVKTRREGLPIFLNGKLVGVRHRRITMPLLLK